MAGSSVEVKKSGSGQALSPTQDRPWWSLRNEIDRMFDRLWFAPTAMARMFNLEPGRFEETPFGLMAPAIDVTEEKDCYKIEAELPGLSEKDIDITISGDNLILKGEKREEHEEKSKNRYLSERRYGTFERHFTLPDGVDRDKISAGFSKGVLSVVLRKTQEAQQQKKIEVKADGGGTSD